MNAVSQEPAAGSAGTVFNEHGTRWGCVECMLRLDALVTINNLRISISRDTLSPTFKPADQITDCGSGGGLEAYS